MGEIISLKDAKSNLIERINREMARFAEEHPKIEAVCFGDLCSGGEDHYIFITKPPYDEALDDELCDLELKFANGLVILGEDIEVDLTLLPFGYEHKNNFPICIYDNPVK